MHVLMALQLGWDDVGNISSIATILSVVPLIVAAVSIILTYRHKQCDIPWCLRIGRHRVSDTTCEVCHHHHTVDAHQKLQRMQADRHPLRLGHGDTVASADMNPDGAVITAADRDSVAGTTAGSASGNAAAPLASAPAV